MLSIRSERETELENISIPFNVKLINPLFISTVKSKDELFLLLTIIISINLRAKCVFVYVLIRLTSDEELR